MISNEDFGSGGNGIAEQLGVYPVNENGSPTGNVIIPNHFTSIGNSLYLNCTDILTVTMPSSIITLGGSCFQGCTSLTTINLPDSITSFDTGSNLRGCTQLQSVHIPNTMNRIRQLFCDACTNLSTIELPESLLYIEPYCFRNCIGLTSLTLPSHLYDVGADTFRNIRITEINIPASVKNFGDRVFGYNPNLTHIKFNSMPSSISLSNTYYHAFAGCPNVTNFEIVQDWSRTMDLEFMTSLTHDCIIDMFNKLIDNSTSSTALTLTLGATNLARVSEDEKLIATNKNWTLA